MTENQHQPHLESVLELLKDISAQILLLTQQAAKDREAVSTHIYSTTEAIRAIAKTLDTHYSETLNALVGKNQLPLSVAMKLFQLMGWMLICSMIALIFTLTGQHFNILPIVSKVMPP